MNEDALNEVFNLSLDAGYTKDLDAFRELMANNEEARAEAFDLSVKAGYTKDINTFTELVGGSTGKSKCPGCGCHCGRKPSTRYGIRIRGWFFGVTDS